MTTNTNPRTDRLRAFLASQVDASYRAAVESSRARVFISYEELTETRIRFSQWVQAYAESINRPGDALLLEIAVMETDESIAAIADRWDSAQLEGLFA